jgi:DNA-binding response OmpR family regulator
MTPGTCTCLEEGSTVAKVLLVEDDPSTRELLVGQLRAGGHDVAVADGPEAVPELIETRGRPDVAVVDLDLKGLDAAAFLQSLRRDASPRTFGAVVVASGGTQDRIRVDEHDAYLVKPVGTRELLLAVASVTPHRHES